MNDKEPKPKCLNARCETIAVSRGLCWSCYCAASRLVREGTTTWDHLVAIKKALPSKQGKKDEAKKLWFLEPANADVLPPATTQVSTTKPATTKTKTTKEKGQ